MVTVIVYILDLPHMGNYSNLHILIDLQYINKYFTYLDSFKYHNFPCDGYCYPVLQIIEIWVHEFQ